MAKRVLLEFDKISKTYGSLKANDQISFQVLKGEIHALIGENGAGKSTLMKILFGLEAPTSGAILLDGQLFLPKSPVEAKMHHIGMVHQHFHLAPAMTALDHVVLEEPSVGLSSLLKPLARAYTRARLQELCRSFQMPVPWDAKIEDLSVGIQQRVEILKLLAFETDILILDEPTAVLTPQEIDQFLGRLRLLRESGKTILLITHKLKEVLDLADSVTVLRQGLCVYSGPMAGQSTRSLASKMVGYEFEPQTYIRTESRPEITLRVEDLCAFKQKSARLSSLNFALHAGEILGVAGIEGNGQSELIKALVMPQESDMKLTGSVEFLKNNLLTLTNPQIRKLPLGLIPEDRLHEAAIPTMSATENYQLGRFDFFEGQKIKTWSRDQNLAKAIADFDVRPAIKELMFSSFSGGNQQKLIVARELEREPKLLIVAQPTRGVDIGAIEIIHKVLIQARNQGVAILLISSELDELLRLCDRMIILSKGAIQATLNRNEFEATRIGQLMGGTK